MKNFGIKLSLILNYFVFAFLLNSVGTVILQVQRNFDVTKAEASILEGFKDLPIAITSFILASFLPKIGLKKSMLIGLGIVTIFCFLTPLLSSFWYFKLLFVTIGISFALIKVSVFATIGLITEGEKSHGSFMGILEAFFMAGILVGNVLFSFFIDDNNPKSPTWLNMYWFMGGMAFLAFVLMLFSQLDESDAKIEKRSLADDFLEMFKIAIKPLVLVFILSVFLYVLIEQSFQTWFPTFYQDILRTPASMGVQAGAVLAGAFMVGRLLAGFVLSKIKWIYVLSLCLLAATAIVITALPLAKLIDITQETTWLRAPLVVYLMPLLGLFLAPIYPTLNSVILSALPKHMHSSMSGLIVVFSALGGTTGSMITGHVFDRFDGTLAFYFSLIPLGLIFLCILLLNHLIKIKKLKI